MTTETSSSQGEASKRLTEVILRGDEADAARIAGELAIGSRDTNDVVDAISETMNIVADLHEVERYTSEQVESCERAAEKALATIRPKIRVEQRRLPGRVMVSSLRGDAHTFDKTLLLTMLEIGGFSAFDGGGELSPEDIVTRVAMVKPDVLAIPLQTPSAVNLLMDAKSRIAGSGSKIRIVAYGRAVGRLPENSGLGAAEEDSMGALSKIAEILLTR